MTTASTVGKPILATRWNCFLFKARSLMCVLDNLYYDIWANVNCQGNISITNHPRLFL